MRWQVLREDSPGNFTPIPDKVTNSTIVGGLAYWQDGYPDDFSGWGDEESAAISAQQQAWQDADASHRCFGCSWAPA